MTKEMQIPDPAATDPTKRQAILDACFKLFAERGFAGTDVEHVAQLAKVGKGTVYRYFGNKEELFRATVNAAMQKLENHYYSAIAEISDIYELIRVGGMAYAEFYEQNPELVEIIIQERAEFRGAVPDTHLMYRERNRKPFEKLLRQAMTEGKVRQLDVRETVTALANLLYGTVVTGCLQGATSDIKKSTKHALDLFIEGIRPRKSDDV